MSRTITFRRNDFAPEFTLLIAVVFGLAISETAPAARVDLPNDHKLTSEHWPAFNPVLNRGRVHASNINSSLHATFRGDAADFNRVLDAFAKSKAKGKLVVIRPGGGDGELEDKPVAEWKLSLPGDLETAYRGDSASPSLVLYLGGDGFDLEKIK